MDDWKTSFLLGWPIFRGELLVLGSVSTCIAQILNLLPDKPRPSAPAPPSIPSSPVPAFEDPAPGIVPGSSNLYRISGGQIASNSPYRKCGPRIERFFFLGEMSFFSNVSWWSNQENQHGLRSFSHWTAKILLWHQDQLSWGGFVRSQ